MALYGWRRKGLGIAVVALLASSAGVLLSGGSGGPKLVSYQPLPPEDGAMCQWVPASAAMTLRASLWQAQQAAARAADATPLPVPSEAARAEAAKRPPIRVMKDNYAAYSAVAVDPIRNEVVMADENLFGIMVYDRMENTPPRATMSEPKRMIQGLQAEIEFSCGLYIDPANGDIYVVNNDTLNTLAIFSREQKGDVPPMRTIDPPHTTFGIAVHEPSQELYLTIQDDAAVVVYGKKAQGNDAPLRTLQGVKTLMGDPHGIAIDPKRDLLFVSNWGTVNEHRAPTSGPRVGTLGKGAGIETWPVGRDYAVPGSGEFRPPSITVYPRTARGDTAPLRVIQGPKTQLNWPTALAIDPERGELYVANDTTHSILIFGPDANGDVAPIRVLQGSKTLLYNPTGLTLDLKNQELWVANFGNHAATVYKMTASGDTAPLRVIRSAPLDAPAPMLGNPHTIRFDSKRQEILVAN